MVSNLSREINKRITIELNRHIENLLWDYANSVLIPQLHHRITNEITREVIDKVLSEVVKGIRVEPLVVPPEQGPKVAQNTLKEIIVGATSILVTDPFFFHVPGDTNTEAYIADIFKVLPLSSLKQLTIIHSKPKDTSAIPIFKESLPTSIKLKLLRDSSIHDRIWIVNENKAYLVGTSFGGLGRKYSFILPLPDEDLVEFNKWVSKRIEQKLK
jgi:hypothetical protein